MIFSCEGNEDNSSTDFTSSNQGQGGSTATFAIKGDYLYVVDEFDLNVFSLLNNSPVFVNKVPIGMDIETLFGYQDKLYVGSMNGMYIFDLENPEEPKMESAVQHFTACDPVVANDSLAFVTLHSNTVCGNNINRLEIYDTSDSLAYQPTLINTRNLMHPKGLGLYGNYVIICDDEIKIFDFSDPENLVLVNVIPVEAFDVIIRDDLLIAIGSDAVSQYDMEMTETTVNYIELSNLKFIN